MTPDINGRCVEVGGEEGNGGYEEEGGSGSGGRCMRNDGQRKFVVVELYPRWHQ